MMKAYLDPQTEARSTSARRRSIRSSVALATLLMSAGLQAAQTPQDKYGMDVVCEARGQIGLPIPGQPQDKTKILGELYAKRVQQSGAAIGKAPAQIAKDIAFRRADMLQDAKMPTNAKEQSARAELVNLGQYCAAMPFFEAVHQRKGGAK